ncbi:hypothetical protein CAPTEDRAFT_167507 [Capitella teleta]|uniref:Cilia-and flagella-associated protein 96 n=1 Tax=Capitella teleta TaxID=283909 RepID=R7VHR7_CAPTE|nr:hypothetical protein CAPTEDRAFT_167507 [Capitella teleta]|eukprot:ELU15220.1 hypothetical protein CAPTEDRAFT_167507 [Capitella teleta]
MADKGFNKTDMERIGIFQEPSYISIGDPYKSNAGVGFNQAAAKGKQMLPGGTKEKSAQQHGYFNEKYQRVLEGEAYTDPIKMRRQDRLKQKTKNVGGKAFLPSSATKEMCGLGNHFGTLSGPISALSPQERAKKEYKSPGKNFYTTPGHRGTGYGYVPITIGQYAKYQGYDYDKIKDISKKENEAHKKSLKGGAFRLNMHPRNFFDENPYRSDKALPPVRTKSEKGPEVKPFKPSSPGKNPAGCKAGTFDPYPSHSSNVYKPKSSHVKLVVNKTGKIFMPNGGPKTAPVNSVLDQNVVRSINKTNYKVVNSVMSY